MHINEARSILVAAVLAGGQSRRMGRDKATLVCDAGGNFGQRSLRRLNALGLEVFLSVASGQPDWAPDDVRIIADSLPDRGPVQGLVDVMRTSGRGVLVTPVDLPNLTSGAIGGLLSAWFDDVETACCATAGDRPEPLVAVYPLRCLDDLAELARSEHRSLWRWLQSRPHRKHRIDAWQLRNVNCPADYEQ